MTFFSAVAFALGALNAPYLVLLIATLCLLEGPVFIAMALIGDFPDEADIKRPDEPEQSEQNELSAIRLVVNNDHS